MLFPTASLETSVWRTVDTMMETYKLAPPNTVIILQILSEVGMIRKLEDESQRILWGGVHSDKWHSVQVLEATACQRFLVELLPKILNE